MNKKKKIFVDTFYFKAAPAGIKTYIKELVASSKKSNSSKYIYIYSHDIKKLENNLSYLNSSLKSSMPNYHVNLLQSSRVSMDRPSIRCISNQHLRIS